MFFTVTSKVPPVYPVSTVRVSLPSSKLKTAWGVKWAVSVVFAVGTVMVVLALLALAAVPPVHLAKDRLMDDYAMRLQSQGIAMDQYMSMMGMNAEMMRASARPAAVAVFPAVDAPLLLSTWTATV